MKDSLRPVQLGMQDRSAEFSGLVLTETVGPRGLVLRSQYHAHANVTLVLRGTFVETVAGHPFEVSPGSLILRPAGEMHANCYDREDVRCLIIEVKPQRLQIRRQTSDILERASHHRSAATNSAAPIAFTMNFVGGTKPPQSRLKHSLWSC